MMKKIRVIASICFFFSCGPNRSEVNVEVVNSTLVENLKKAADSTYIIVPDSLLMEKQPFFVKGEVLINSRINQTTQLWFDEQNRIMGMMEYTNDILIDSILFHTNGQRLLSIIINKQGQPEGPAAFYYSDGRVRLDGRFEKGIQTGIWREFAPDGRLLMTHEYDRYGIKKR